MQKDINEREKIYPWKMSNGDAGSRGVIVYLEIDNRRCTSSQGIAECFPSATEVYIIYCQYK